MECKKCEKTIDDYRYHIGYTECVECSEVEKYSAHQVYPHKTGGYVQPVTKTASKNLKKMDRRSTGSTRTAKGIYADQSWDRWLEKYWHDKYNPKPKRKVVWKSVEVNYLSEEERTTLVQDHYDKWGYYPTLDYCMELYKDEKISMAMKSKLVDMVNEQQMLPKRLRKWVRKIS